MFPLLICLTFTYLALTAHVMGASTEFVALHWPAVAVVIAARWLSPTLAVVWAFGIGICLDGMGRDLMGVHAVAFVAIVWWLTPMLRTRDGVSPWRWAGAAFLATGGDLLISWLAEHVQSGRWEHSVQQLQTPALSVLETAVLVGTVVLLWRQSFGGSCATH